MAATALGKNTALEALTAKMSKVGLLKTLHSDKIEGGATGQNKLTLASAKANGYVNGKVVVFKALTASVTSFVVGRPYFVVGEAAGTFELAEEQGGTGIEILGAALTTATETELLEELPETPYARVATTWQTGSEIKKGEVKETGKPKIKVAGSGTKPTYVGWWSVATKAGETTANEKLYALNKLTTPEPFESEGELELTSDKVESGLTVA